MDTIQPGLFDAPLNIPMETAPSLEETSPAEREALDLLISSNPDELTPRQAQDLLYQLLDTLKP